MFTPALFGYETPQDSDIVYAWAVTYQDTGHRCGYVGVPVGHPCYGMDYNDVYMKFGDIIDVHGGLTYTADGNNPKSYPMGTEQPHWWLGFDCAHYRDARDPSIMSEKYKEYFGERPDLYFMSEDETIKDDAYVVGEIMKLIKQLDQIERMSQQKGSA